MLYSPCLKRTVYVGQPKPGQAEHPPLWLKPAARPSRRTKCNYVIQGQYWRGVIRTSQYWSPFQGRRCPSRLQTTFLPPEYDSSVHNACRSTSVFWAWFRWQIGDNISDFFVCLLHRTSTVQTVGSSGVPFVRKWHRPSSTGDVSYRYRRKYMITWHFKFEFNHLFIAFSSRKRLVPSIHPSYSTKLKITQTYVSFNQPHHDRNNLHIYPTYVLVAGVMKWVTSLVSLTCNQTILLGLAVAPSARLSCFFTTSTISGILSRNVSFR